MFNLRQLKAFTTIAETGSFTTAAKVLYMTQPAISAQIKALEERLDVHLLERHDKNVVLTDAGQLFYGEAKKILQHYDGFVQAISELKGIRRGNLRVAASTIPGEYILPRLLGHFGTNYPGIELSLKIADTGRVAEQVLRGEADLGFIGAGIKHNSLYLQEFMEDELILIGAPQLWAERTEICLEDLLGLNLVLRENGSGTRMEFYEQLQNLGVNIDNLQVVMELGSTRAVITAVESGIGISVVSRVAAQDALALGKIVEIKLKGVSFKRSLYLVWNANRYQSFAAKAFLKHLETNLHMCSRGDF